MDALSVDGGQILSNDVNFESRPPVQFDAVNCVMKE